MNLDADRADQAPGQLTVPYWSDDTVTLHHGDCLDVLTGIPDNSVHAIVTDPPYGLEFMGKDWDKFGVGKQPDVTDTGYTDGFTRLDRPAYTAAGNPHCRKCGRGKYDRTRVGCECPNPDFGNPAAAQMRAFGAWCAEWTAECLRVLKPGGHLLAFGGTRTWHRLASAVEDAGFEMRDSIAWLYGSGFPKSLDVSKAIDKAAGATRETTGTYIAPDGKGRNAASLSVNGEYRWGDTWHAFENLPPHAQEYVRRKEQPVTAPATPAAQQWAGWGTALKPAFEPIVVARKPLAGTVAGNVLAYGTGALNIDGCRVEGQPRNTHRANGNRQGTAPQPMSWGEPTEHVTPGAAGRWPTNVVLDDHAAAELDEQSGDRPGMARGVPRRGATTGTSIGGNGAYGTAEPQEAVTGYGDSGGASRFFPVFRYEPKAPTVERPRADDTAHPTVKPLDLMRWLVRLVTPPGGTVLDPFAGSGTTGEACVIEGARCVLIEREAAYLPLIVARLNKPIQPDLFGLG